MLGIPQPEYDREFNRKLRPETLTSWQGFLFRLMPDTEVLTDGGRAVRIGELADTHLPVQVEMHVLTCIFSHAREHFILQAVNPDEDVVLRPTLVSSTGELTSDKDPGCRGYIYTFTKNRLRVDI